MERLNLTGKEEVSLGPVPADLSQVGGRGPRLNLR